MNQSDGTFHLPSLQEGTEDISLGFETLQRGLLSSSTLPLHAASIFQEQSLNMLPSSLTRSTRHALATSTASTILATSTNQRHPADEGDVSLLNASTSSYKDHRDSPLRPRLVSIQAERVPTRPSPKKGTGLRDISEREQRSSLNDESIENSGDLNGLLKNWESTGEMCG